MGKALDANDVTYVSPCDSGCVLLNVAVVAVAAGTEEHREWECEEEEE